VHGPAAWIGEIAISCRDAERLQPPERAELYVAAGDQSYGTNGAQTSSIAAGWLSLIAHNIRAARRSPPPDGPQRR
jgi:hypothetical protein